MEGTTRIEGAVTVRYFAGAAAAAGTTEEQVPPEPGMTVDRLAGLLARRHGPALERVLGACSFLVDELGGGRDRPVPEGARVDVLPPFAGG